MLINGKDFANQAEYAKMGRGCATTRPNNYQIARNDERLRRSRFDVRRIRQIDINVQFIHILHNGAGRIPEQMRVDQVSVLNKAFRQFQIRFTYQPNTVKEVENSRWFFMDHGSQEEREAKTALHTTPERNLNFYTGGLAPGLLGWATFPWEFEGDRIIDGVAINWQTLPGSPDTLPDGVLNPYNMGMTAVHEIGHWLGLFHTFQGGCDAFGDHIPDTVPHSEPNYGKPEDGQSHGACQAGQMAPIHNYMNYVDDAWMHEFTLKQIDRVLQHIAEYRPGFIQAQP